MSMVRTRLYTPAGNGGARKVYSLEYWRTSQPNDFPYREHIELGRCIHHLSISGYEDEKVKAGEIYG